MNKIGIYVLLLSSVASLNAAEEKKEPQAKSVVYVIPEVLCWRAQENGLGFAVKSDSASSISEGRIKNLHFQWDAGYRLGIGAHLPWDKWDAMIAFTHFHTTSLGRAKARKRDFLFPSWTTVGSIAPGGYINRTKTRWRLHLGLLDVELGRMFFASKQLTLRPFIGTRTAWVRQKYRIVYKGGALFPDGEDDNSLKNKFFGTGPRAGINSSWLLPSGFSLYGNAAYSLVYGHIYVHQSEELNGKIEISQLHDSYHITRDITDLALGIRWERGFYEDRYHFDVHIGWEQHMFFGQNQLVHFPNPSVPGTVISNQGDLTLQGFVGGARFDF